MNYLLEEARTRSDIDTALVDRLKALDQEDNRQILRDLQALPNPYAALSEALGPT